MVNVNDVPIAELDLPVTLRVPGLFTSLFVSSCISLFVCIMALNASN